MLGSLILQDNGVPIYVQLRDQIAAAIGRGELKPGERLATMREVAVALAVDLNTVQRAYQALADEGLLTMVQGRGSFVAETPARPRNRENEIHILAAKVAAQARAQGITPDELADALKRVAGPDA
ncbi:MAG TPA: GntR family transcriptional regulator [Rhizomicrobium sp.]|jgi:GntR family transcriptional regulator|nr:GntR family transcriptional regulator [Rhizomicrobium sp.]